MNLSICESACDHGAVGKYIECVCSIENLAFQPLNNFFKIITTPLKNKLCTLPSITRETDVQPLISAKPLVAQQIILRQYKYLTL